MSSNSNVKNHQTINFHQRTLNRDTDHEKNDTVNRLQESTNLDNEDDCSDSDEINSNHTGQLDEPANSSNPTIINNTLMISNSTNNSLNNKNAASKPRKVEKIRECINQCISKGPGNPFGKKADIEVQTTYIWIASHLEEDSTVSLPKHEVYEEYKLFCESNSSQPLCVADFGKAMKHMFPNVKPRRLGQRGNSRYCYSGLRKKINFEKPELPDLYREITDHESIGEQVSSMDSSNETTQNRIEFNDNDQQLEKKLNKLSNDKNLVLSASSHIILEWARKQFSLKLSSIKDLAKHLILLNCIDKESMAALTVIASDEDCEDDFKSNLKFSETNLKKTSKLSDNLSFRKLLSNEKSKKKKSDKDQIKSIVNKRQNEIDKSSIDKAPKIMKTTKRNKSKKDKLTKPIVSKIKLESFDNLTGQTKFTADKQLTKMDPIEINKTKNTESENQFIENTQHVDLNQSNSKRRHSTIVFESNYNRMMTNQLNASEQNVDDTNYYKYQFKRQTSEQLTLTKKRNLTKLNQLQQQQLNGFSANNKTKMPFSYSTPNQEENMNSDSTVQCTNYLLNQANAKNNQLVSYKKYFNFNQQSHQQSKVIGNELIQQQQLEKEMKIEEPNLMSNNIMPQQSASSQQTTISTQVDEQELYQYNMFEDTVTNRITYNSNTNTNEIYHKNNAMIIYPTNTTNENTLSNMCNVNTQMPSIPPSPINSKDDPFANQFNQMVSDKIDFNNNLTTSALGTYSSFSEEQQIQQLNNSCQLDTNSINSPLLTNQLNSKTNNQKMFINSQINQTMINKSSNRSLNRVRHSSGPSHSFSSLIYNTNSASNFLSNAALSNIRSNSLSPLYENCQVDSLNHQKMTILNNLNNFNANNGTMVKYACGSPVSPVGEPISPNFNFFDNNKKQQIYNLRFGDKFGNPSVGQKKEVSRSASLTNSNDSLIFSGRIRHRHMSSPHTGPYTGNLLPSISTNLNSNQSFSTQSLNNSSTPFAPFNDSNDLFNQQRQNDLINQTMTTNLVSTNTTGLNHPSNINLSDGDYLPGSSMMSSNKSSSYQFPPSPPLSSCIINEEKVFKNFKANELANKNNLLRQQSGEWNNGQAMIAMNLQQQQPPPSYVQQQTQAPVPIQQERFDRNLTNENKSINDQPIIDDLQTTLQDLKDCDKDFSKFF